MSLGRTSTLSISLADASQAAVGGQSSSLQVFARDGNLQHVMYNQFFICRLIRKVAGQRIGWKLRPLPYLLFAGYSSSA
jgi:hypothetical protein